MATFLVNRSNGRRRDLQIAALRQAYLRGALTVAELAADVLQRVAEWDDPALWITLVASEAVMARARALDDLAARDPATVALLPLFGIPFAVKDNIDVAGLPTTAACPGFAYTPEKSAPVIDLLLSAGALLIGKTNLDQFATGLVGTRSPYGIPRNAVAPGFIPGGSSSGSAVAVASGLVSLALGTDTAGSGRVPAAFNNIVGLKPTRGLISTSGVVPACRSLDCVSIFALTVADARAAFEIVARWDEADPFARKAPKPDDRESDIASFRFGVPASSELDFFGDDDYALLFQRAAEGLAELGGSRVEVPFAPFRRAAGLLYDGPYLAERLVATQALLARDREAVLPVTREIIERGRGYTALDAYAASYELAQRRRESEAIWREIDILLLPTTGTAYRVAEVVADPFRLNAKLGRYTNFVNLLDLAAIAVPAGFRPDGMPFGITLLAPAFADRRLAALAARFQQRSGLTLGATGNRAAATPVVPHRPVPPRRVEFAVVGAHMSGMALNGELQQQGAQFVAKTRSAAHYRLYLLDGKPARPGLLRVGEGEGFAIEAEIWSLAAAAFGAFVAAIPPPLSIGTVELEDGSRVKGFLCEAIAVARARDISSFGGWRQFLAQTGETAQS